MTIELAQEVAAVQRQRGVRDQIENPYVPHHARVDEDLAGPHADRRGNVTEILGLGRPDSDPVSVRLEIPKQRVPIIARRELASEQRLERKGGEADMAIGFLHPCPRSAERRVGKECVITCSYRWSRYH